LQPMAASARKPPAATTRLTGPTAPVALLREADSARERGDNAHAVALLERVVQMAPGSTHAALASWTLARMRLAGEPSLAAADIDRALRARLPVGLREAAAAHLVEARAAAGDIAGARAAAAAYRNAYPEGGYLSDIARWTSTP
jgi:transmembrane sensor